MPRIGEIKELINNNKYRFVVIDSLYRTGWLSEENSNDSTSKELGDLQGLAEETSETPILGPKNLSPFYKERPPRFPPVGWGALDGGE